MAGIRDIEAAVAAAEAQTGVRGTSSKIPMCIKPGKEYARRWTEKEDRFIKDNVGKISEKEMARQLGRTVISVHLRVFRDLQLSGATKDQDLLTAEHIAWGLGLDGKSIHMLMDRGLMPGYRLPFDKVTRVIKRVVFIKWLLDPMHWVYFKPDRVGALRPRGKRGLPDCYDFKFWEEAQDQVQRMAKVWDDAWLTPGQAAKYMGFKGWMRKAINTAIHKGNLPATRWGNWWIQRSVLPKGKMINAYGQFVDQLMVKGVKRGPRKTRKLQPH